ncbi:Protein of unknown function [Gryllus bimaculatus]|nr:Protein of unknown function [Gryllus bimaculatus]
MRECISVHIGNACWEFPTGKCRPTNAWAAATTPSTPSSARRGQASTCPGLVFVGPGATRHVRASSRSRIWEEDAANTPRHYNHRKEIIRNSLDSARGSGIPHLFIPSAGGTAAGGSCSVAEIPRLFGGLPTRLVKCDPPRLWLLHADVTPHSPHQDERTSVVDWCPTGFQGWDNSNPYVVQRACAVSTRLTGGFEPECSPSELQGMAREDFGSPGERTTRKGGPPSHGGATDKRATRFGKI